MKKGLKILRIVLGILLALGIFFFVIDFVRAKKGNPPLFCIPTATYLDGGTHEFLGLGYI